MHTEPRMSWPPALNAVLPGLAAVAVSAVILLAVGVDPLAYYTLVVRRAVLSPRGLQETITRSAPLMLLAASLLVSFRTGIWNLGMDGQFLLAAVLTAGSAPVAVRLLPAWLADPACMLVGMAAAALWSLAPALLRACQGVNEIITTLLMNFLGVSLANLLVKLVFADPQTTVPITRTLPIAERLPQLGGSTVHLGVPLALGVLLLAHLVLTRTAFGLRLQTLGASPRAARHAGLHVGRLTVAAFTVSAALAGLAGSVEVLGVLGNVRAEWNPAYGLTVIPLVFLARLNGFAVVGFAFLFSALSIGAESAAIRLGVPQSYNFVLVALLLIFLALAEFLDQRRQRAVR